MTKTVIVSMLMSGCLAVLAQNGAAADSTAQGQSAGQNQIAAQPGEAIAVKFVDDLTTQLENVRSEAGLDAEKYYSAIAVAKVGVAPNSPKYALARQYTFAQAFADALQQIAGSIRLDMENAVSNGLLSDTNGLKKADLDPRAAALVNDAAKKQLVAQGVDLSNPDAIRAAMPKVIETASFKQATSAAAQLFLSGVVCFKTVAKDGEIGILAYYSPATKKFAEALVTKRGVPRLLRGINVSAYLKQLQPQDLANTFGPRVYVDENGQMCIVSFAQNPVMGNQSIARIAATRLADSFIQDFIGSNFALEELVEGAKDSATLSDAMGNLTQVADVSQRVKSLAQRSSGKLTYHGIKTVLTRTCQLPSGHRVIVIARMWSPSLQARGIAAGQAADRGAALREAAAQGQDQSMYQPETAPANPPTSPYQNRETEGGGATGFVL